MVCDGMRIFLFLNLCNFINPLSANPTKWSNILKRFVANFPTNCLSVFDHFVKLALNGLKGLYAYTSVFKKPKMKVFILHLLACSSIYNL